ncbi:hypothetical protein [Thermococcus sp.]|nr:hypothetical protein [Thermococcus sp.]
MILEALKGNPRAREVLNGLENNPKFMPDSGFRKLANVDGAHLFGGESHG